MGLYYYLCCKSCEVAMNMGKRFNENGSLELQGVYSEREMGWLRDRGAWLSLQGFLQEHEGHEILFCREDAFPMVQLYEYADADKWR